jgi:hypothetical protein
LLILAAILVLNLKKRGSGKSDERC